MEIANANWKLMNLKGNNPSKWPIDLEDFFKAIQSE